MGEVRYRTEASSGRQRLDKTRSVVTEGSVTPPRPAAGLQAALWMSGLWG